MKITVLIEDHLDLSATHSTRLVNEFGLSLVIESNDRRLLLDTGTTGRFADNADILGVNLNQLDAAVISHAHYDHGGGLAAFFDSNQTTPVYIHEDAAKEFYSHSSDKLPFKIGQLALPMIRHSKLFARYIGIDHAVLKKHENQIHWIKEPREILSDIFLIPDIVSRHPKPRSNQFLLAVHNGRLVEDSFHHELILAVREDDGLVLFSGCCHNGILNLVATIRDHFGGETIKAVVGGFHLKAKPGKDGFSGTKKDIEQIGDALLKEDVKTVVTGHCTGKDAFEVLQTRLKNRLRPLATGAQFNF